jgi:hypothetical protein
MHDYHAGLVMGADAQTATSRNVGESQLGQGQAQLLDEDTINAGHFCAGVQKGAGVQRGRHGPMHLVQLAYLRRSSSAAFRRRLPRAVATFSGWARGLLARRCPGVDQGKALDIERVDLVGRHAFDPVAFAGRLQCVAPRVPNTEDLVILDHCVAAGMPFLQEARQLAPIGPQIPLRPVPLLGSDVGRAGRLAPCTMAANVILPRWPGAMNYLAAGRRRT